MNKISSMLDAVADSLEAQGLIKEAYEIDKIADALNKTVVEVQRVIPGHQDFIKALMGDGTEITLNWIDDHWEWNKGDKEIAKSIVNFARANGIIKDPKYTKFGPG